MTDDRDTARQQRLRTALRENLKRRKSQIRGRSTAGTRADSSPVAGEISHDIHEVNGTVPQPDDQ